MTKRPPEMVELVRHDPCSEETNDTNPLIRVVQNHLLIRLCVASRVSSTPSKRLNDDLVSRGRKHGGDAGFAAEMFEELFHLLKISILSASLSRTKYHLNISSIKCGLSPRLPAISATESPRMNRRNRSSDGTDQETFPSRPM